MPKSQKLLHFVSQECHSLRIFSFKFKRPTPIDSTSNNEMAFHLCTHRIMNFIGSVRLNCFPNSFNADMHTNAICNANVFVRLKWAFGNTYLTLSMNHTVRCVPWVVCARKCVRYKSGEKANRQLGTSCMNDHFIQPTHRTLFYSIDYFAEN